ncbi:MAG: PKD domain-containing protein [Planctomycetota bacterium]|nr:PKD domain-containing protein [Planctomycetota bacterium]
MIRRSSEAKDTFRGRAAALAVLAALLAAPGGGGETRPSEATQAPTALIELDGSDSENPGGGELAYEWTQIDGPKVELSDPAAAKPYFRTGKPGLYRFQLVVSSNGMRSEPFIVELMIERENQPPVARSPRDVQAEIGKPIEIDGRGSYDPDGDAVSYRWRPLTRGLDIPAAALGQSALFFVPKTDGVFEIELVVSDGVSASHPSVTRLIVKPRPQPPVAKARAVPREIPSVSLPEQTMAPPGGLSQPRANIEGPAAARIGESVMLDARGSRSVSGGRLEYLWRQKAGPFISDFELVFDGAAERFRPARPGDYEFELVVSDGSRESEPAIHRLRVIKDFEPPVAVVVAPTRAMPGALVRMDATQSYDLAGSTLSYLWRQTGGPKATNWVIDERLGDAAPAFHPPAAGIYSFELIVSNGRQRSRPVEIDIEVGNARRPPVLSVEGPEVANAGEGVALAAAVKGADAAGLSLVWRQVEGPAPALQPTNGSRAILTPPLPGRYVVDLAATKDGRVAASARHAVEVFAPAGATGAAIDFPAAPPRGANAQAARPAAQIHPATRGTTMLNSDTAIASALEPLAPLK